MQIYKIHIYKTMYVKKILRNLNAKSKCVGGLIVNLNEWKGQIKVAKRANGCGCGVLLR